MVPLLRSFSMSCTCRNTRAKVKPKPITHGRNNKIKYNQLQDLVLWAKKTLNGVNTTSGAWWNTGVRKLQLVRFSFESDWCKFLLVHMLIIECPNTSLSTVISSNLHFDKDYVKQESYVKGSPPRSLGDQVNITNFSKLGNSSTKTLYRSEQGNVNHFKDHKSDNEFGSNIGNKRTQANFKEKKELFPTPSKEGLRMVMGLL